MPQSPSNRDESRPNSGEAPFHPGEVFYSRTDQRGVLISGNYVFRRVAHYDWEELLGAPHKVIRHPDMPKGVFHIFWDHLKRGKVIGAYVKNKAKDGLHYWVYAVAMPCQDGFLSARIKPTSTRLKTVSDLYARVRERELNEGLQAADSADVVLAELKTLGFDSYGAFTADSLSEELICEGRTLGLPPIARINASREMLGHAENLGTYANRLSEEFETLSSIPVNMQIRATRLEGKNGPIMTLARAYGDMSNDLSKWFKENVVGEDSNFSRISDNVQNALFLNSTAGILRRCNAQLQAERRDLGAIDLDSERDRIVALAKDYAGHANDSTQAVTTEAKRIKSVCAEMRRSLLGMSTVRITCNIENARLANPANGLGEIVNKLEESQGEVMNILDKIDKVVGTIIDQAAAMAVEPIKTTPPTLLYGEKMAQAMRS
jgi:aerotaxis receptor